jgi:hypothetical protein
MFSDLVDRAVELAQMEVLHQSFQRFLSPLLRGQFERPITSVIWQRKHFSKQRGIVVLRRTWRRPHGP